MWETIGIVAGVIAAILAVPAFIDAIRGWLRTSVDMDQRVLDALPVYPVRPDDIPMEVHMHRHGAGVTELAGKLAISQSDIRQSLERLIRQRKVEVAILRMDQGCLPLFFKGGIEPSARASKAEISMAMNAFQD